MKATAGDEPFVLQRATDGSGREHDLYLVVADGGVVLSCPSAFWSIRLSPTQASALWPAIKDAGELARQQVSP